MCTECIKDAFFDRGSMCLDTGTHMANFKACCQCQSREPIENIERNEVIDGDREVVTYKHICGNCEHIIAEHEHTFELIHSMDDKEQQEQEFIMSCALCGSASDSIDVLRGLNVTDSSVKR